MKAVIVAALIPAGVSDARPPQVGERFLRRTLDGAPYRLFVPGGYRGRESFPLVPD